MRQLRCACERIRQALRSRAAGCAHRLWTSRGVFLCATLCGPDAARPHDGLAKKTPMDAARKHGVFFARVTPAQAPSGLQPAIHRLAHHLSTAAVDGARIWPTRAREPPARECASSADGAICAASAGRVRRSRGAAAENRYVATVPAATPGRCPLSRPGPRVSGRACHALQQPLAQPGAHAAAVVRAWQCREAVHQMRVRPVRR